jgi:2-succinyl-6-hydroxy-2,4-cyclohexadiene-1-carboxylate synthase
MKRTIIHANGLNFFCFDTGADKPVILCLHGRWGRSETWSPFMNRYCDRFRLIAPDQRGHGLSDKPLSRYATEDLAADAYHIVRELGCRQIVAVGHSMGGRVAAQLAASHPELVRALAILDCTADGDPQVSSQPPEQVAPVDDLTKDWPTPYFTLADARADLEKRFPLASNVEYFMQSLHETTAGYDFFFSRRAMAAIGYYNAQWFDLLPRIQCPTLFVRAADSWDLPRETAEKMRALIRDVEYAEISGSDHMVYADNPADFYPLMDNFLSRVS